MTKLTRQEFQASLQNKDVDVSKLDKTSLKRADLNKDGLISGVKEKNALFREMDNYDKNGTRKSVDVSKAPIAAMQQNIQAAAKPKRGLAGGTADSAPATAAAAPTSGKESASDSKITATIDSVKFAGKRNQMASGSMTVNGNTYKFNSGGQARGSLPKGTYNVERHRDTRNDKRTMQVGGEGYSFALSDKFDSRVGDTRKLLRIHPDGGNAGTEGCVGIVGDAATQRQFRKDMLAELKRNGGKMQFIVN
jgi:hypothetical protein